MELLTPVGNEVLVSSPPQTIINGDSIKIVKDHLGVEFGLSGSLGFGYSVQILLHLDVG
jgi:hypothetical protein